MEAGNYSDISRLENNWWYASRRELIRKLLEREAPYASILDFGCGTGANFSALSVVAEKIIGVDAEEKALELARRKKYDEILRSDGKTIPLPSDSVEAVVCADVLEHIEQDGDACLEIQRVLKPGGILVVTVPAFPSLWNRNDEYSLHWRRYKKRELTSLLSQSGFEIMHAGYWNLTFLFPVWIYAQIEKLAREKEIKKENNLNKIPPLLDSLLLRIMRIENTLHVKGMLPCGVSLAVLARKSKL